MNKIWDSTDGAVADMDDGSTVMISGFGDAGIPSALLAAVVRRGPRELTIVCNNAGHHETDIAALMAAGLVRKVICSYPRHPDGWVFNRLYAAGKLSLELVPQGTLAERIRAAGAGLGAFFTPTGAGTELAQGKETRTIHGRPQILEHALHADYALIDARQGDPWGNLVYDKAARNYGPVMAMAARTTIAQVREVVAKGDLDPEHIVTPGIFVQRVVRCGALIAGAAEPATETECAS